MDYLIPTANEVPAFRMAHVETPSPFTEYGIKGGGEGGRMVTPSVVSAAIDDALRDFGMRVRELPVKPSEIVATVQAGALRQGPPDVRHRRGAPRGPR
ncbi:hypothetical protein ACFQV4_04385 [Streptomyces thermocarboxydus]